MTSRTAPSPPALKLDTTIPVWGVLGFAGFVLLQACAGIVWAARMSDRMDAAEAQRPSAAEAAEVKATLAKLDERTLYIVKQMDDLSGRIDHQEDRK